MSVVGNVIQVRHVFEVFGVECLNVFYYEITAMTPSPIDPDTYGGELATYYTTQWAVFAGANAVSQRVEIDDLTNGLEFAVIQTGVAGANTGDTLPATYAMNVKLPRATKVTRNGSKRISGLTESRLTNGVFDSTGGTVDAIKAYCSNAIVLTDVDGTGGTVTLAGRIVGRTKNVDGIYELDLSKLNAYGTPVPDPNPSTQRTRLD